LAIVLAVGALTANLLFLRYSVGCRAEHATITKRIDLVQGIKPRLDGLEKAIWGVISIYDPLQGRKVGFQESGHHQIIQEIVERINEVSDMVDQKDMKLQMDILRRSVTSLARRTDVIREKFELKRMDEESTELLFPGSDQLTMLSESYVDEMEKATEQIRFVINVINNNLDKYLLLELAQMQREDEKWKKQRQGAVKLHFVAGALALITALLLLRETFRLKVA